VRLPSRPAAGATRGRDLSCWAAILALALIPRLAPLVAGKPYPAYADEGNLLHPVIALVRSGGWDPGWYLYPQLPVTATTAALRLWAPAYDALHDRPLVPDLPAGREVYDLVAPFDVLVAGRLMSLLAGLGVVALVGRFARELAGSGAGYFGALLAALTPALAIRGAIATIDPWAALFALASLFATHRSRSAARPGLAGFAAGALAGCAFASKYPAVVVLAAFAATTLLDRHRWRETLRRLVLAGVGLAIGTAAAMPAAVTRPGEVLSALEGQRVIYEHLRSPGYWRQALLQAEWDLPFVQPELGALFLAAAGVGLWVMLRDRGAKPSPGVAPAPRPPLAPLAGGWLAFAVLLVALYGRLPFQPFRNLLPLVPVACLAVTIAWVALRETLAAALPGSRHKLEAGAVLAVLLLFGPPLAAYAVERVAEVDSRVEAVDWLAAHVDRRDTVLFVRQMAFLPAELERLGARAVVRRWEAVEHAIAGAKPRFVVGGWLPRRGDVPVDVAALPWVRRDYVLRADFGEDGTPPDISHRWRGSRQRIYVFERRAGPRPEPPRSAGPRARRSGAGRADR
jgi:hypothetical protein